MLTFPRTIRIHLASKPVCFRNGHHGLAGLVRNQFGADPVEHVWVFHNVRRTDLKILWFDHGGFFIAHKKLARGRFRIPAAEGHVVRMSAAELAALLEGIDLSRCERLPRWNPAAT